MIVVELAPRDIPRRFTPSSGVFDARRDDHPQHDFPLFPRGGGMAPPPPLDIDTKRRPFSLVTK